MPPGAIAEGSVVEIDGDFIKLELEPHVEIWAYSKDAGYGEFVDLIRQKSRSQIYVTFNAFEFHLSKDSEHDSLGFTPVKETFQRAIDRTYEYDFRAKVDGLYGWRSEAAAHLCFLRSSLLMGIAFHSELTIDVTNPQWSGGLYLERGQVISGRGGFDAYPTTCLEGALVLALPRWSPYAGKRYWPSKKERKSLRRSLKERSESVDVLDISAFDGGE